MEHASNPSNQEGHHDASRSEIEGKIAVLELAHQDAFVDFVRQVDIKEVVDGLTRAEEQFERDNASFGRDAVTNEETRREWRRLLNAQIGIADDTLASIHKIIRQIESTAPATKKFMDALREVISCSQQVDAFRKKVEDAFSKNREDFAARN